MAPETLWEVMRAHALALPAAPAVLGGDYPTVTFAALWRLMQQTVDGLHALGIGPQDVVATAVPQRPTAVLASMAVQAAAGICPVDVRSPAPELAADLRLAGATALVAMAGAQGALRTAAASVGIPFIELHEAFGAEGVTFRYTSNGARPSGPADWAAATTPGIVGRTSGTTGVPDCVHYSQAAWLTRMRVLSHVFAFTPNDRALHLTPLPSAGALSLAHQTLLGGGSVFVGDGRAGGLLRQFEAAAPTWYYATPSLHQAVLEEAAADPGWRPPHPLRFIRSGGAPGTDHQRDALEALFQAPVRQTYSMTSTTLIACEPPTSAERRPGTVGRSPVYHLEICDPEGVSLPTGETGEIVLVNPEDDPHGWFRGPGALGAPGARTPTGDLGYLDADGYLSITGRLKEVIQRGGMSVLPVEIEAALREHPTVREAVAFGVPHPLLGESVAAAVVLHAGSAAGERELRGWLADRLAAHKVPARIVLVDTVPVNDRGKVARRTLSTAFASSLATASHSAVQPATPLERTLLQAFEQSLRRVGLGVDDDYFELGGTSLSGAMVMDRISRSIGRQVPAETLWQAGTVRRLAEVLEAGAGPRMHPDVVVMRPQGEGVPLFLLAPPEQRVTFFPLAAHVPAGRPLYTISPPFADEDGIPLPSIEAFATRAVAAIRSVEPSGPYHLAGYSWAGTLAFEVARQLVAAGLAVGFLGILDTQPPASGSSPRRALRVVGGIARLAGPQRAAVLAQTWRRLRAGGPLRSAYATSTARYRPRPYRGRVVVFQAEDTVQHRTPPAPYWTRLAAATEVITLPGDHASILTDPAALAIIGARLAASS